MQSMRALQIANRNANSVQHCALSARKPNLCGISCRFYDKAHKIDMLDFFKQFAVSPDDLPDTVFASVGRTIWRDIGPTALSFRVMMKVRRAL